MRTLRHLLWILALFLPCAAWCQYSSLRFPSLGSIAQVSSMSNGDVLVHTNHLDQGGITRLNVQGNEVWSYNYGPQVKATWNAVEMNGGEVLCLALYQDTLVSANYVLGVLRLSSAGAVIRAKIIYDSSALSHIGGFWTAPEAQLAKHDTDQGYHLTYRQASTGLAIFYNMSSNDQVSAVFKTNAFGAGGYAPTLTCRNGSIYTAFLDRLMKMDFTGTVLWSKTSQSSSFTAFGPMVSAQNELYVAVRASSPDGSRAGIAVFDTLGVLQRSAILNRPGVDLNYDGTTLTLLDEGPVLGLTRGANLDAYAYVAKFNSALTGFQVVRGHSAAGSSIHNVARTAGNGLAVLSYESTIGAKLLTRMPAFNLTTNPYFFFPCWADTAVALFSSPFTMLSSTPLAPIPVPSTLTPVNVTRSALPLNATVDCTAAQQGFSAQLWLEGPFNPVTGLMSTSLLNQGLIPLTEPYSALGYAQYANGGGETTTNAVLTSLGIVDWVRLELRSSGSPGTILATRQALLRSDGAVWSANGQLGVRFGSWQQPGSTYHLCVRHRNHLGAMLANPVGVPAPGVPNANFSNPGVASYGTAAMKTIGSTRALWMGNTSTGTTISYIGTNNDRDPILLRVGGTTPNNSVIGYWREDANLDGVVKYTGTNNDRDPILLNVGSSSPNAVRIEQVP